MATATRVDQSSAAAWAAHRIETMPKPLKKGDIIPDVTLSRLVPKDSESEQVSFSTREETSKGLTVIFTVPKIHCPDCCTHVSSILKTAQAFKRLGANVFIASVNTQDEMYSLEKTLPIPMIPDWGGDFTFACGLGMDKSGPTTRKLGFVAQRAAIVAYDGVVLDVEIDEDATKCNMKPSWMGLLARIPSLLASIDRGSKPEKDEEKEKLMAAAKV